MKKNFRLEAEQKFCSEVVLRYYSVTLEPVAPTSPLGPSRPLCPWEEKYKFVLTAFLSLRHVKEEPKTSSQEVPYENRLQM